VNTGWDKARCHRCGKKLKWERIVCDCPPRHPHPIAVTTEFSVFSPDGRSRIVRVCCQVCGEGGFMVQTLHLTREESDVK
jgi:ribosomal protein S14